MILKDTPFEGLYIVDRETKDDRRGSFCELYKESAFRERGIIDRFVQTNMSTSAKGVLRGLHYQMEPSEQGKLVFCLTGSAFDVAVDVRPDSATYLKHFTIDLTPRGSGIFLPRGFAHGFYARENDTTVVYQCTREHNPRLEAGIKWDDAVLNIAWPAGDKRLSDKDNYLPCLK